MDLVDDNWGEEESGRDHLAAPVEVSSEDTWSQFLELDILIYVAELQGQVHGA